MERWKQVLNKLLFPGKIVTLLSIPISAVLLIYAFGFAQEENPIVYLAYVISAYTLVSGQKSSPSYCIRTSIFTGT